MSGKTPPMAFTDAVNVKAACRLILEQLGIDGYYQIAITDRGPQLTVYVAKKDTDRAREALSQRLLTPPAVLVAPAQ